MRRSWPVWRTAAFLSGLFALLLALVSGIDLIATELFSVHMVQHMLLTVAAAPLLMLGAPIRPMLRGLPRIARATVVRPLARSRPIREALHFLRHPLVAGAAQNTVLGGLLSFSTRLLYRAYARTPERFGLDPVTDQRIGGAVMWVIGDFVFLAAASISFFLWLAEEEEMQRRRERITVGPRR